MSETINNLPKMEDATFDKIFSVMCKRLTSANKVQDISKQFNGITSDEGRVAIAYQHLASLDMLPYKVRSTRTCMKCAKKSTELRERGNKVFGKANAEALLLYTESIATAPCSAADVELALAFANRSAVFFAIGSHESCLSDIQCAIAANYPEKLKYKILERQGKCLRLLGRSELAKQSFEAALATSIPEDKAEHIRSTLLQLDMKDVAPATEAIKSYRLDDPLPSLSYAANQEIPCASDAMLIKYSPHLGRYIAAARDIVPGDVLLVERPYASVLLPQYYLTHCYNCLRRCAALIPCEHCALAMFCSEECRSESWTQSHHIECSILPSVQQLDMGKMSLLALRIVLISSQRGFQSLAADVQEVEERSSDPRTRGFTAEQLYKSSSYSSIHCLVGNTTSRTVGDLFRRATKAACILNCLETCSDLLDDVDADKKAFVGGLALRYLQSLPCNAHSVTDLVGPSVATESHEFGCGAYATLSLLNHSCDPNVTRTNHRGDVAVLRAVRPITAGEQILDNYGFHYAIQSLPERQTGLQDQYYFKCQCKACVNDWPTYHHLPDINPGFICTKCRHLLSDKTKNKTQVVCGNCQQENNICETAEKLGVLVKSFNGIYESLLSGSGHGYTGELSQHLLLLERTVVRPWRLYNDCQEALKECFMRGGNFYKK